MNQTNIHEFESALRELGSPRLRLDQVVKAYHTAFPANAMRADMRDLLHEALLHLVQDGAITVSSEDGGIGNDPTGLPQAIELSEVPSKP